MTTTIPYEMLAAVPLSVFLTSTIVTVVVALTVVGQLIGSCYKAPRKYAGGVWGFVLSLLFLFLLRAVMLGTAGEIVLAAGLTSAWFIVGLVAIGAIR